MRRTLPLLLPLLFLHCSSGDTGTIQILTGEETDTFTQTPVPTTITVIADSSGTPTTLASGPYATTTTLDLGKLDENTIATIEVEGLDANNNQLIFGQSVPLEYGALAGSTLPIFVQRRGQNARLPNPLADGRQQPTLGILSGRFLIVAGGSDSTLSSTTNAYDFAQFDILASPPTLPRVPLSMPILGTVGVLIDDTAATFYDFSQDTSADTTPPSATFGFGDVAGGQSYYSADGSSVFVVGATRTAGAATAAVLWIDTTDLSNTAYPYGNFHWLQLSTPRLGASAAYVTAYGLVVAGGSATGAGVEVLTTTGPTTGTPLPYAPDPSQGAGMGFLGGTEVLIAGGVMPDGTDAGVRAIDVQCVSMCTPAVWSSLPVPLTLASTFGFDQADAFLVGSETSTGTNPGLTHTFLLNTTTATEVPTKVMHMNASATVSPVGSIIFMGGVTDVESYVPTTSN